MSDFYRETEHVARKAHKCAESGPHACRRTAEIKPGTRYVRCFGVSDGRAFTERLCLRCARLYGKVWERWGEDHHRDDMPTFGNLREWIRSVR